jgi:hypothetical protein
LAHRDLLVTQLEHMGFTMTLWDRLGTEGVSGMYSTFMFVYKNDSPGPRGPEPPRASLDGRGSTTDGGSRTVPEAQGPPENHRTFPADS